MIRERKTSTVLPAAGRPVELPFDPGELLRTLETLVQEFEAAAQELKRNRDRRAQLQAEIDKLDAEARGLSKRLHNAEVQSLLKRLAQLPRPSS
jgi:predicted nuclease with TOPRIM domain